MATAATATTAAAGQTIQCRRWALMTGEACEVDFADPFIRTCALLLLIVAPLALRPGEWIRLPMDRGSFPVMSQATGWAAGKRLVPRVVGRAGPPHRQRPAM